jgi:hypothetical protein
MVRVRLSPPTWNRALAARSVEGAIVGHHIPYGTAESPRKLTPVARSAGVPSRFDHCALNLSKRPSTGSGRRCGTFEGLEAEPASLLALTRRGQPACGL